MNQGLSMSDGGRAAAIAWERAQEAARVAADKAAVVKAAAEAEAERERDRAELQAIVNRNRAAVADLAARRAERKQDAQAQAARGAELEAEYRSLLPSTMDGRGSSASEAPAGAIEAPAPQAFDAAAMAAKSSTVNRARTPPASSMGPRGRGFLTRPRNPMSTPAREFIYNS